MENKIIIVVGDGGVQEIITNIPGITEDMIEVYDFDSCMDDEEESMELGDTLEEEKSQPGMKTIIL